MNALSFFFGTLRRTGMTLAVVFVALCAIDREFAYGILAWILSAIIHAFGPLVGPVLGIAIAVFAIRMILSPIWPMGRRKR